MSSALKKKTAFSSLWKAAIDTLLPPRCAATGEIVDAPGMVSPEFWSQLQFIDDPFCKTCGIPFSFDISSDALCASCMERTPLFDQSRSSVTYNEASRKLVLAFKYGDRLHSVHTFAPWMIRAGQELIDRADFIIPVPLHHRRLRERRFNQSALLAQEIAVRTAKNYIPDALQRVRHTIQQKGLSIEERNRNIHGAFAISGGHHARFRNKNVLLIDDVFTTGATLNECARILKAGKAAVVNVLTIARVTKEEF